MSSKKKKSSSEDVEEVVETEKTSYKKWSMGVKKLVRETLEKYASKKTVKKKYKFEDEEEKLSILDVMMKDEDYLNYFYQAFTHKSFDSESNYELLETEGDKVWNLCVATFCFNNLESEGLNSAKLSDIMSVYTSVEYQSPISRKLGFLGSTRIGNVNPKDPKNSPEKIAEDVQEAFFGALFIICNLIVEGTGFTVCYEFASNLLVKEKISVEKEYKNVKNQLSERFGYVKWFFKVPEVNPGFEDDFAHFDIPNSAKKFLQNEGLWDKLIKKNPDLDNLILAQVKNGKDGKEDITKRLYIKALKNLDSLGLTKEWFLDQNKKYYGFNKEPWFSDLSDSYNSATKGSGISFTFFSRVGESSESKQIEIHHIAKYENGNVRVINKYFVDRDDFEDREFQKRAIEDFIKKSFKTPGEMGVIREERQPAPSGSSFRGRGSYPMRTRGYYPIRSRGSYQQRSYQANIPYREPYSGRGYYQKPEAFYQQRTYEPEGYHAKVSTQNTPSNPIIHTKKTFKKESKPEHFDDPETYMKEEDIARLENPESADIPSIENFEDFFGETEEKE